MAQGTWRSGALHVWGWNGESVASAAWLYGGFGRSQVSLFFAATRTPEAGRGVIPQQSYYQRFWSNEADERMDAAAQAGRARGGTRVERFEATLDRRPVLDRIWRRWKRLRSWLVHRLPRRLPPVDQRY